MSKDDFLELKVKNKANQPRTDRGPRPDHSGKDRSATARLRAASRTPEAVVKVISFANTRAEVQSIVDYDTRKGEIDLELKDSSIITDRDEAKDLVDAWSVHFRDRKNARNGMHLAISTPNGTDPEVVRRVARAFGQRAFGDGYDYGFVVHTDSGNPHAHFIVVRDGQEQNYLGWNKAESQRLRDIMVEEAEKVGLVLNATPRYARGRVEKAEPMAARKAREREGISDVDYKAALEVINEMSSGSGADGATPHAWTDAISERLRAERKEYDGLASSLEKVGQTLAGDDKEAAEAAASMVRRQAMALRQMDTRRDHMRRLAEESGVYSWPNKEFAARDLAHNYREDRSDRERREKQLAPARTKAVQAKLDTFTRAAGATLSKRIEGGDKDAEQLRDRLVASKSRARDKDFEK